MRVSAGLKMKMVALLLAVSLAAPQLLEARFKPSSGSDAFTRDQEIELGQKAAAETNRKLPILPDSDPITQYVQQLGAKLVAQAPGEKWPFSFHVVNQKEINAFAIPGGPIYVNLGTIQAADNEAQLAGVIAHEASHVVLRHGTRAATKQMKAQMPLQVLGALLGNAGILGSMLEKGIGFGVGSYFLRYSRQAETEADLLGTDMMYDAGYDPKQMAEFFRKLEAEGGAGVQFLSDHPNPGNRVQAVNNEVATLPPKKLIEDSPDYDRTKAVAMQRKPLTGKEIQQAQDAAAGQESATIASSIPAPSTTLQTLNSDSFQVSYPANWKVHGDNSSTITIAPEGGVGEKSVAYGVIIDSYQPEGNVSLDEAAHQLVAALRQGNPELRTIGNDESIRVNGREARSQEMVGASPVMQGSQAIPERDWLVTMQRGDGSVIYLVFIAPEKDFSGLLPTFENMLRSFEAK